jgi:hypothetical protein
MQNSRHAVSRGVMIADVWGYNLLLRQTWIGNIS